MLEDFFQNVVDLKKIQRKGWKKTLELKNPESVADHSYSMTVMAMILSEMQGLDSKKIMKMSLLHDLAESVTGDFTPDEISKQNKSKLENNAMKKILAQLPKNQRVEYQTIWDEFQLNETDDSKFIHELDKLEMVFQAKTYYNSGFSQEKIQTFLDTAKQEIKNKQLQKIMSNLF